MHTSKIIAANDSKYESTSSFEHSMLLKPQEESKMNEYEAKQAAQAAIAKSLQTANPHLRAGQGCVIAAKNIRIELKKAFPKIKFSVTSSTFAGGDSVRVGWTDGVTVQEVDQIANKYKGGHFDGSDDSYTYNDSAWTDAFGSAKYISTSREYSLAFVTKAIEEIAEYHDGDLPTAEDFKNGKLWGLNPSRHCESWQNLIYRAMCKTAE